jgi:hypothetical protein
MMWTLLITGWVLISRWNVMYLIWMILLNITITLYWSQVVITQGDILNLILLSVNFGFILLWEILAKLKLFDFMLEGRWILYLLMIPALIHATFLMTDYIFSYDYQLATLGQLAPVVYSALMVILIALYTTLRRDLAMLTLAAVSLLVVFLSGFGRWLYEFAFETVNDPFLYFLVMGIFTVLVTGGLVIGLRRLQRIWGES